MRPRSSLEDGWRRIRSNLKPEAIVGKSLNYDVVPDVTRSLKNGHQGSPMKNSYVVRLTGFTVWSVIEHQFSHSDWTTSNHNLELNLCDFNAVALVVT